MKILLWKQDFHYISVDVKIKEKKNRKKKKRNKNINQWINITHFVILKWFKRWEQWVKLFTKTLRSLKVFRSFSQLFISIFQHQNTIFAGSSYKPSFPYQQEKKTRNVIICRISLISYIIVCSLFIPTFLTSVLYYKRWKVSFLFIFNFVFVSSLCCGKDKSFATPDIYVIWGKCVHI